MAMVTTVRVLQISPRKNPLEKLAFCFDQKTIFYIGATYEKKTCHRNLSNIA